MLKFENISKFIQTGKLDHVYTGSVMKKSDTLLKVRLWFYSLAYVHLILIAAKLLTIDFTKAQDPTLWVYETTKWKLITCWFNLLSLVYFPICIYCDLKELRREEWQPLVRRLNNFRFLIHTSILFPTTTFADVLFWRLWIKDRELIAPEAVDEIVPFWTQHCMHTVTLVVTILDLVLVPRKRPRSFTKGLSLMSLFLASYYCVTIDSYMKGEYLYPIFKRFNGLKFFILSVYVTVEHLFLYFGQFFVHEFLWGKGRKIEHQTQ